MNTTWQKLKHIALACVVMAFCCQCQTDDAEVVNGEYGASKFGKFGKVSKGLKKEGGFKFSDSDKKSEGEERMSDNLKNQKVIKNSKGEVVRKESRTDLYTDRGSVTARETNQAYGGKKQAKFKDGKFSKKEFKTPEYLQRQEYAGSKTFKEGSRKADESGSQAERFVNKLFQTDSSSSNKTAARENGSTATRFNKKFETSTDRTGTKAFENAARPTGVAGVRGYRDNLKMSMDDVKKLVNPEANR